MRRIAAIGDVHACIDEFRQLLSHLEWLSLDEIWHLGDLVDRGPDSGAVVGLCREKGIKGILGNHEESVLKHYKRVNAGGELPQNEDKKRTLLQLEREDWDYLQALPLIHVDEELKVCLVHGGVWPSVSLYKQPKNVVRCQMMVPDKIGDTRWFGKDASKHKSGCTEEQNYDLGWRRWYELYDHEHDCYFGHSVFTMPMIHQNPGYGRSVGVDTGSCFGGSLTAAIIGEKDPWFVSVRAKKAYADGSYRLHQE